MNILQKKKIMDVTTYVRYLFEKFRYLIVRIFNI